MSIPVYTGYGVDAVKSMAPIHPRRPLPFAGLLGWIANGSVVSRYVQFTPPASHDKTVLSVS